MARPNPRAGADEQGVPPGFVRLEAPPAVCVIREDLGPALERLGVLGPDGLDVLLGQGEAGHEGRGTTRRVAIAGRGTVVVRPLLHGGLLGPWLGDVFWGMGRPLNEIAVTEALRDAGAPVPQAAFAIGQRVTGPLFRAAFASFEIEDTRDALVFLRDAPPPDAVEAAAAALGRAVRRFHDAGGRHGDLHVKNLLLRTGGAQQGPEAFVIDLDGARVTPGLTPGERMAQLMRLFRSLRKRGLLETVGLRGCARFFGAYCQDDRALRRAMWSRIDRELRRVAVHALGYGRDRAASPARTAD